MRLNSLQMKNFKKYGGRAEIEFQDGLTGIVGQNGSGKSTIVEAVAWALYGNKASTIKRDFIKNSRAREREDVEVELSLNLDGQELSIVRAMRGKNLTPEARLFIDGGMVATGTREVDARLEDVLRIGFQDFMKTFYSRQKDLDNLLKEGGTKKKEYLLTLLGLDQIREEALNLIRSDAKRLEGEIGKAEGALLEIGNVEERMDLKRGEVGAAREELSGAEAEVAGLESALVGRRQELESEAEKRRSHERLAEEMERFCSAQAEKKGTIEQGELRLEEIEEGRWQLFELEPKLSRLDEVRRRLEELEPKRKEHQKLIQTKIRAEADSDAKLRALGEAEARLEKLKSEWVELESIRPLEEEHRSLASELEALEERRDLYRELRSSLEREIAKKEAAEDNLSRAEAAVEDLRSAEARLLEIEPLRQRYESLQKDIADFERELERKKALDDLSERLGGVQERIRALAAERSGNQDRIFGLGDLEGLEEGLRLQESELDQQESNLKDEMADLNLRLEVQRSGRDEAKVQLSRIESLGEESNCPTCERPLGDQRHLLMEKYRSAATLADEMIEGLEKEISDARSRLDEASKAKGRLKRSFENLAEKKAKRGELLAEIRSLEARLAELEGDAREIEAKIEGLGPADYDPERHREIVVEAEKLEPLVGEYAEIRVRLEELPRWQEELEKGKTALGTLTERIDDLGRRIDQLDYSEPIYAGKKKRLAELKVQHERFSTLKDKIREMPGLETEVQDRKGEADRLGEEVEDLKVKLVELGFDPSDYEAFQKEGRGLNEAEKAANQIRLALAAEQDLRHHLDEARESAARLESDLAAVKVKLSDLDYSEVRYQEAKIALDEAKLQRDRAREQVSDLRVRVGVLERDLERLRSDTRRKLELQQGLADLRRQVQVVETTRSLTNRFMDHILVRIRNEIAINAGRILRDVTGKYGRISIDEGFNILVEDEGEFYPISRYSGGEIDMMAVSVRIAISEYLMRFGQNGPGYSFLILDEIFGSQDVEHRESMIEMLRSLDDRFPQIFVISHIGEVQGQFDNTILVVEEDGTSRVEI